MIKVHKEKCPANHECAVKNLCPGKAITQKEHKAPELDSSKCDDECNLCVENCPNEVFEKE